MLEDFLCMYHCAFKYSTRFGRKDEIKYISFGKWESKYRVIRNVCWGFNSFSYTIHLRLEYLFAPMDQEIRRVFFMMCGVK